jgi:hypothetical protein
MDLLAQRRNAKRGVSIRRNFSGRMVDVLVEVPLKLIALISRWAPHPSDRPTVASAP